MDKVSKVTQEQIEKNIVGKWIVAEVEGKSALTNEKRVLNVVSTKQAFSSFSDIRETISPFDKGSESTVDINGNVVTFTFSPTEGITVIDELTITDISADNFTANCKGSIPSKSSEPLVIENDVTFIKIEDDYSDAVLGTWEGRCTSAGSVFDDGMEHRWEYKKGGTYVY